MSFCFDSSPRPIQRPAFRQDRVEIERFNRAKRLWRILLAILLQSFALLRKGTTVGRSLFTKKDFSYFFCKIKVNIQKQIYLETNRSLKEINDFLFLNIELPRIIKNFNNDLIWYFMGYSMYIFLIEYFIFYFRNYALLLYFHKFSTLVLISNRFLTCF